jgi:sulfur relay (sulfurtransferase) DsrF/TusC family protein
MREPKKESDIDLPPLIKNMKCLECYWEKEFYVEAKSLINFKDNKP